MVGVQLHLLRSGVQPRLRHGLRGPGQQRLQRRQVLRPERRHVPCLPRAAVPASSAWTTMLLYFDVWMDVEHRSFTKFFYKKNINPTK